MDRRVVLLSTCTLIILLGAPTTAPAQGSFSFPFGERGFLPRMRGEIDTPPNRSQIYRREYEIERRRESDYRRRQIERERLLELQYEQQRRQTEKKRYTPPVAGNAAKAVQTPGRASTAPSSPAIVNKPAVPVIVSKPIVPPAPEKDGIAPGGAVVGGKPTQMPPAAPVIVAKPTVPPAPEKDGIAPGGAVAGGNSTQMPPAASGIVAKQVPALPENEVTSTPPITPTQDTAVTKPSPDKAVAAPAPAEPEIVIQPGKTAAAPAAPASPAPGPAKPAARDIDVSELDTSATSTLNSEDTRRVQVALKGKGFDPGPIDGVLSPQTQAALRTFQTTYGIDARGVVDAQTLLALGEAELASRSAENRPR